MKKFYPLIFLLILFSKVDSFAQFGSMGTYDWAGVPNYLSLPSDVISNNNKGTIASTLPEKVSVPVFNPQYLSNTPTDIKLIQASDVYITFVTEGAVYLNALGFYTYDVANPPTTAPSPSQIKVIFPNCSLPGSGGNLNEGNKVFLGHYPAGTGIGWVCIGDAFQGGLITTGRWTLYSNPNFNPESDPALRRHNVLLSDTAEHKLILGFEDIRRDDASCDHDFNDMIFYVDVDGADTDNIPPTNPPSDPVTPGDDGGLESESLGDKVSKRDYARMKSSISPRIDYNRRPVFSKAQTKAISVRGAGSFELPDMMPASFKTGYTPFNTSPKDILSLTKAVDVLAIDYTKNNKADAVVLGIKTLNETYNHTKQTCDRFKGGVLRNIDTIRIQGNKFIRFAIKNAKGGIEYAISFTVSKENGFYNLQTNWLRSEYGNSKTMYTFQVWASMPHYSIELVNGILNNLSADMPVKQTSADIALPKAFITMGKRVGDKLQVFITNKSNATSASLYFDEEKSESAPYTDIKLPISLRPYKTTLVSIPVRDGFTYEGVLKIDGKDVDGAYFADGNWGLDYDASLTAVNEFAVENNPDRKYPVSEFPVYRDVNLSAKSSDYITLYKFIQSGGLEADLSSYNTLKFFAKGTGTLTVKLAKESVTDWRKQYYTTIELVPEGKEYAIRFDAFHADGSVDKFKADDVNSIIYTALAQGGKATDIHFSIADVSFANEITSAGLHSKLIELYPNPSNGKFSCGFVSEKDAVLQLTITDLNGKTIWSKEVQAKKGMNTVPVELTNYAPGVAVLSLKGEGAKYKSRKFLLER